MAKGLPSAARVAYDQKNLECANIIASDPVRYEGIMLTWAKMVIERLGPKRPEGM